MEKIIEIITAYHLKDYSYVINMTYIVIFVIKTADCHISKRSKVVIFKLCLCIFKHIVYCELKSVTAYLRNNYDAFFFANNLSRKTSVKRGIFDR